MELFKKAVKYTIITYVLQFILIGCATEPQQTKNVNIGVNIDVVNNVVSSIHSLRK
jgi:hypothetical protein